MRQRSGQFSLELIFGFLDFTQQLLVFREQYVWIVVFVFRRVGVFQVEIEDRPVQPIAGGLGVARLKAQRFGLFTQGGDLRLDRFTIGSIGAADQTFAQIGGLPFQRRGLVVELFGALPVRCRGGLGLRMFGFEIDLPGVFVFHAVGEVVGLVSPPCLLRLELLEADGLGL